MQINASRVASITILTLTALVFAFWFVFVRAPSPTEVCQHKIELVLAEVGADKAEGADVLIDKLQNKCVERAADKIKLRGKLEYAKYARCVVAATSLADAERC